MCCWWVPTAPSACTHCWDFCTRLNQLTMTGKTSAAEKVIRIQVIFVCHFLKYHERWWQWPTQNFIFIDLLLHPLHMIVAQCRLQSAILTSPRPGHDSNLHHHDSRLHTSKPLPIPRGACLSIRAWRLTRMWTRTGEWLKQIESNNVKPTWRQFSTCVSLSNVISHRHRPGRALFLCAGWCVIRSDNWPSSKKERRCLVIFWLNHGPFDTRQVYFAESIHCFYQTVLPVCCRLNIVGDYRQHKSTEELSPEGGSDKCTELSYSVSRYPNTSMNAFSLPLYYSFLESDKIPTIKWIPSWEIIRKPIFRFQYLFAIYKQATISSQQAWLKYCIRIIAGLTCYCRAHRI